MCQQDAVLVIFSQQLQQIVLWRRPMTASCTTLRVACHAAHVMHACHASALPMVVQIGSRVLLKSCRSTGSANQQWRGQRRVISHLRWRQRRSSLTVRCDEHCVHPVGGDWQQHARLLREQFNKLLHVEQHKWRRRRRVMRRHHPQAEVVYSITRQRGYR